MTFLVHKKEREIILTYLLEEQTNMSSSRSGYRSSTATWSLSPSLAASRCVYIYKRLIKVCVNIFFFSAPLINLSWHEILTMAQSNNTTTPQTQSGGGENQSQTYVNFRTQTFIDSNSYYHLHPLDNLSIVFVTCVLGWDNYPTWSRAMENSPMLRTKSHLLMEYLQNQALII